MPKPIVNNRINNTNLGGRVIQHDLYLNQSVRDFDSPTFANIQISGDATISGNLYVEGNTSILNTNIVEFKDNIILVNDAETGSGVTLNQSGVEVDRGQLENYRFVWDELSQNFMVGVISHLQPVTLRETSPLQSGVMVWNSTTKLIESRSRIDIPVTFTSSVNSTSASSGTVIIGGGVGIEKDVFINGKMHFVGADLPNQSTLYTDTATNSLNITSSQNINLLPSQNVTMPFDTSLLFGDTQGISAKSVNNSLKIYGSGNIDLTPGNNNHVAVPNQTPIVFSTTNEKIYTDSSNNMVVESSQSIILKPANGNGTKSVDLPVDTPLTFSNNNQQLVANVNNDLSINAGNNILLNPGPGLSVRIPTDNTLKFGGSGTQTISADSNNDMSILSTGDIYLTSSHVNIPVNIPLTFNGYTQYIKSDTNGSLLVSASNNLNLLTQLYSSNTTESTCATNGAVHIDGGLGVSKSIVCETSVIINSQHNKALTVTNPLTNTLFTVDASNYGGISVEAGDGTTEHPALNVSGTSSLNAKSLIQLTSNFDNTNGYMIGRGTSLQNDGRVLSLNLPSYSAYGNLGSVPKLSITSNDTNTELFSIQADTGNIFTLGTFGLGNTQDSTSPTSAAFIVSGGLGVVKSIYTSGKYISSVDSIQAFQIQNNAESSVFNIDTINNQTTVSQNFIISTQNTNAFTITDSNVAVFNVDTVNSDITTSYRNVSLSTVDSADTSHGSYVISGGIGVQKTLNVGGVGNFYNGINMQNNGISNLTNPSMPQDAATKAYVDLIKQGLFVKDSVAVATVSPLALDTDFIPGLVIDGYTLLLGDRILIKNQNNGVENGLYNVTNSIPTRTTDLKDGVHAIGTFVFVENGDLNGSLGWICNTPSYDDIVGSSVLSYTQFTALGKVHPGSALSKDFNTLHVNVDDYSIEINNNQLRLSSSDISTGLTGGSGTPLQTVTDQSHVTKLGTINMGAWQGSAVQVAYGGTGRTTFNSGNILFGNGANAIGTDSKLFYNATTSRLGLGTNTPNYDFDMEGTSNLILHVGADSDANNINATPQIQLSYNGGNNTSQIGMTRHNNDFASGTYPDALVISNDQTDGTSCIQLATNNVSQVTILNNGYVGINNSAPNYTLDLNGSCNITGLVTMTDTQPSNSATDASVIITGGVSIQSTQNAYNAYQGGALTVSGGVAILGDLFVAGQINTAAGLGTFAYLTITATDESLNETSGALVTFGGITIQCTTNSSSYYNGGSFLTPGGASIGLDLYVGGSLHVKNDAFINSLFITSNSTSNFIESPNSMLSPDSFIPIYFTKYNDTSANILTVNNNGLIINTSGTLQIGGSLLNPDGYSLSYDSNKNLNILPNSVTNASYNINIGTTGSLSNVNIYGYNNGSVKWESTTSNLMLTSTTTQLTNENHTSESIILTTPDISGITYIKALTTNSSSNMILNLGQGSTSGQLITKLSNGLGDSTITFIPSNITSSTLVLTNNVYSTFSGPTTFTDRVEYAGNALHQTINNTSGSSLWVYIGKLNTTNNGFNEKGYCEIDFACGSNQTSNTLTGLKLQASISGTTCTANHLHYGSLLFNSSNKPISIIYKDTLNNYQIFLLAAPHSQTNVNVLSQVGDKFLLSDEGISALPNGLISGFSNWTQMYTTQAESTLSYTFGDTTIEGSTFNIADNFPVIGYNNNTTTSSRDLGTAYQRYQNSNDTGSGDIVNDQPYFIDSIPNQSTATLSQIVFSNLASTTNNYYIGWWIKIFTGTNINQVRQIIAYNGSQRVATLADPLTGQNPSVGDSVCFYNFSYVVNYYDETNNTFSLSYTHDNPRPGGNINNMGNADLRLKRLYATDTTVSTNSTTGSIYTLGSIAISNTNDAQSSSSGGTFTSAGGIAVRKNVLVGNNIGVGNTGFTPQESLHIRKTSGDNNSNSTIRLENDHSAFSYIDFVEHNSNNRYGVVLDSANNIFNLTSTTSGTIPPLSYSALTVNSSGYVGINATSNVISPLGINANNFISTNSSMGFLGLIGAASNVNDNSLASRIVLNANNSTSNPASLQLYSGNTTSGNINMYTGNDVKAVNIDNLGSVTICSTQNTKSNTTGALIVSGGMCVQATENSTSLSSGGALMVAGGACVDKDLYIGGNIFINGSFTASGSVTSPALTFSDDINCTLFEYYNNNLSVSGNFGTLTFGFSVIPTVSDQDCEIQISLPGRTNAFIRRFEVVSNVTGYTDETNVVPIFNVIGCGIVGTPNILIKFQSVNTSLHSFQVQCSYILA